MSYQVNPGGRSNEYGMQRREVDTNKAKATREAWEAADRAAFEQFEAARKEAIARHASENFDNEVISVAASLAAKYSPMMRHVEAVGWSVPPYPQEGEPKVDRVTLRGLDTMSIEEAVRKGILTSRGLNEAAYRRAVEERLKSN